ncbi:MAG: NAD(P)/FAD-dependent oxidoreductase [Cyclobacteriaceae bacterium]
MSESKTIELTLSPEEAFDESKFTELIHQKLGAGSDQIFTPLKRSIDARGKKVVIRLQGELGGARTIQYSQDLPDVSAAPEVLIIGAGPAGMFAALRLMDFGLKPVILERGKDVRARRRDIAAINKDHVVNPDSNYCFGEGGAGTYSDGKLYTRSVKRGNLKRILEILHVHGAREEILFDAHPHIGTNKLPGIITAIRETILRAGGQIYFQSRVIDITFDSSGFKGVVLENGDRLNAENLILSTGHSARDIFQLLDRKKILIESKPFALGIRAEHPQALIDKIQYHCADGRGPYLPAAPYALVHQAEISGKQRGVFSFCMCPGGFIVPSATAPGEVVVNGMSPSRRDSRFANSGIVVSVDQNDFSPYNKFGALSGLYFQSEIEKKACITSGQTAPAQRLEDFIEGKISSDLPECSYQPGLESTDLKNILPQAVSEALRQGFIAFGTKMKGYRTNEAVLVGVESRSSSPVRIPRNPQTLEHIEVAGLYPCGEGAGYAGGIVSAAMDGERVAEAIALKMKKSLIQNS